jgi:hypothetical protein
VWSWELRENATELESLYRDFVGRGDRVFDAGECGFVTDDHHLGAGDLGTDLW